MAYVDLHPTNVFHMANLAGLGIACADTEGNPVACGAPDNTIGVDVQVCHLPDGTVIACPDVSSAEVVSNFDPLPCLTGKGPLQVGQSYCAPPLTVAPPSNAALYLLLAGVAAVVLLGSRQQ